MSMTKCRYPVRPLQVENNGPAVINPYDSVDLPTSNDGIENGTHVVPKSPPAPNRQLVNIAELQNVRYVVNRCRPLGSQIVWVLHAQRTAIGVSSAQPRNTVVRCR